MPRTKERPPAHTKCQLDFPADGSRQRLICTIDPRHRYDLRGRDRRTVLLEFFRLGLLCGGAEAEVVMVKTRDLHARAAETPFALQDEKDA